MILSFVIEGEVPSKKNSRRLVVAGSRVRSLPSTNYEKWHQDALWQLKKVKPYKGTYPVHVIIEVYPGTKRRRDLDNISASVLDTIVDAGIIEDDDIGHVKSLRVEFLEYDKDNPRVHIMIGEASL